jgi:uncharacterized protein
MRLPLRLALPCLILSIFLISLPSPALAGMEEVRTAYDTGDFAEAYALCQPLAKAGDADAQNMLGYLYSEGLGAKLDKEQAVRWYRSAAKQGHASAQHNMGVMRFEGKYLRQDYTEAAKWFNAAARQGEAASQFELSRMYFFGKGVPRNAGRGATWAGKAAVQGHEEAMEWLKDLASKGIFEKTWLLEKGIIKGEVPEAAYWMGEVYDRGPESDKDKAATWYRKAAGKDLPLAQYRLGMLYLTGEGVWQSDSSAEKWLGKAAKKGVAPAQYQLGLLHEKEGDAEELSLAYCWLHAAQQRGEDEAHAAMNRIAAKLTQEERHKAQDICWED